VITDGNGMPLSITIESLGVDIFTEIEVQGNVMTLKSANKTVQSTYFNSEDDGIVFNSPEVPFKGGSVSDRLHLFQFKTVNSKEIRISYFYEKKK
jgi:hypothetical protein